MSIRRQQRSRSARPRLIPLLALLCTLFFGHAGCSDVPKDPIAIRIISDQAFTGYYIVDGGATNSIGGANVVQNVTIWEFNQEIKELDSVDVLATRDGASTYIKIMIFRDGDKVKEKQLDAAGSFVLTLEYTYGEEDSSSE